VNLNELHAWNLSANDLRFLRMAQGSSGANVTLPSGITITDNAAWQRLLREAAGMND
jgi:hypothetical protein